MTGPVLGAPLLTPEQVAEHLAITKEVLYDHVQAGRIRAVRLSTRRLRFTVEDVEHFITSSTTQLRAPRAIDGLAKLPRAKSPGARRSA